MRYEVVSNFEHGLRVKVVKSTLSDRINTAINKKNEDSIYTEVDGDVRVYHEFKARHVADLFSLNAVFERFQCGSAYILNAQTGKGKSTLIWIRFAFDAMRTGGKLLVVEPRSAIDLQMKRSAAKALGEEAVTEGFKPTGLRKLRTVGNVDFVLLQDFQFQDVNDFVRSNASLYKYVIIDEIHAFVDDAGFIPYTAEVLRKLVFMCSRACRVYLSATSDCAYDAILALERELSDSLYEREFNKRRWSLTVYSFAYDFSHIYPVFFYDKMAAVDIVIEKADAGEKSIIFVNSVKDGQDLLEKIERERSGIAEYIDATTKNSSNSDGFQKMVEDQKFEKDILISTKVFELGANFKDDNLKNIIVYSYYKDTALQEIGRKRILKKDDTLTVFFWIPGQAELNRMLYSLRSQEQAFDEILKGSFATSNHFATTVPKNFYLCMGRGNKCWLKASGFFKQYLRTMVHQLEEMLEYPKEKYEEAYRDRVLSWLPNHQVEASYRDGGVFYGAKSKEVEEFLSQWIDTEVEESEIREVDQTICRFFGAPRRKSQGESKAPKDVNKYIVPYGYRRVRIRKGVFTIRRISDDE